MIWVGIAFVLGLATGRVLIPLWAAYLVARQQRQAQRLNVSTKERRQMWIREEM